MADAGAQPTMAGPADRTLQAGTLTVAEPVSVPLLRLVTQGHVAETRISGARAGRGSAAELRLPEVPTVSRVHARSRSLTGNGGSPGWAATA